MTFTVRDLMLDVLPETGANDPELWLCQIASQGEPKPPPKGPPKPAPPPVPCPMQSQTGLPVAEEAAELPSLAVLREQLQQALHP
jgi:hypothetical protein